MIQIDMPMPDNCLECRFNTSEFGYCNAMPVEFVGQVSDFEEDGKPEWCPLKAQEPMEMSDAELMDAIRKAPIIVKPAVDAEPVKCGQWTERHVDYASDCAIDEVQTAKCSVCGLYHTTPYLYSFTDFKFCPNCGAKMDGEADA